MPDPIKSAPADHSFKAGETLPAVARTYGFPDWTPIYDHEKNKAVREKRGHPGGFKEGDTVHVPERRPGEVECATCAVHRFRLKAALLLSLVLKDDDCIPYGGMKFALTVDGKKAGGGTTDPEGGLSAVVPSGAKKAKLEVYVDATPGAEPMTWQLQLARDLPEVDDVSGLQARLTLLDFPCPVTGVMDEATKAALMAFQEHVGIAKPSGALDDETKKAIEALENQLEKAQQPAKASS